MSYAQTQQQRVLITCYGCYRWTCRRPDESAVPLVDRLGYNGNIVLVSSHVTLTVKTSGTFKGLKGESGLKLAGVFNDCGRSGPRKRQFGVSFRSYELFDVAHSYL